MVRHHQRYVGHWLGLRACNRWSLCAKCLLGKQLRHHQELSTPANINQTWIFWINLPFIGVAFVFVPLFLKLNFKASNFADQLKRVDWVGSVLFIGSTTSFLIPITWVCVLALVVFGIVLMMLREECPMHGTHGGPSCHSSSASSGWQDLYGTRNM